MIPTDEDIVKEALAEIQRLPGLNTYQTPESMLRANVVAIVSDLGEYFALFEYDKPTDTALVYYENVGENKQVAKEKLATIFERLRTTASNFMITSGENEELYENYKKNFYGQGAN